jgi:dihydroxyacetone kinase-like protein
MAPDLLTRLIDAAVIAIRDHTEELTALDQAIGDGDHGLNMKRGFDAIAAEREVVAALPLAGALQKIGMTLVMKVGGASGPLYGSLFMAMGKALPAGAITAADVAAALDAGIQAVQQRGKSSPGEKTMLDVLVPAAGALRAAAAGDVLAAVRDAAAGGLESTRPMRATKGRASYLGERSIGHLDPGARSSQLLIDSICAVAATTTEEL